jgi:phosphoribosylanthranilate isomerase
VTIVKICGIMDLDNGLVAIDAGADYLGFIFYPPSSRYLLLDQAAELIQELRAARPSGWKAVGVFVNEPLELVCSIQKQCALDVVQLNGEEPADYSRAIPGPVFKSVRFGEMVVDGAPITAAALSAERILLDANVPGRYGGTGVTYDWAAVRLAVADGFLAGGLAPENVAQAIEVAQPWGVDVSSGVERQGRKDPGLIRAFLHAIRQAQVPSSATTMK